jgi:hypothetical protein
VSAQLLNGVQVIHSKFEDVALWIVLMLLMMVPWTLEVAGILK